MSKKRFIFSAADMAIAPGPNPHEHSQGWRSLLMFPVFFYLQVPLDIGGGRKKKFLPALQHFKWKVEECLVRNITFYFLTFIWCADPLVLCNTGDFSCSNCVINPLIKDWACQGSNSYQSAAVLQKIPVSLENTGKLQKGLNKIQPWTSVKITHRDSHIQTMDL